jgi:hypothetical protein
LINAYKWSLLSALRFAILSNFIWFSSTSFAVWADADTWFERQQQEEGLQRLQAEHQATIEAAEAEDRKKLTEARDGETEAVDDEPTDPMAQAEAEALSINPPHES